jgi:hypothetical protein
VTRVRSGFWVASVLSDFWQQNLWVLNLLAFGALLATIVFSRREARREELRRRRTMLVRTLERVRDARNA